MILLSGAISSGASVGDYLGKPVNSVRLVIDGRDTTEAALLRVVETRIGRPLSMLEVRESVSHLFRLGRFDDVRVDAAMHGAGVALRYELIPIRLVSRIDFTGTLLAPGIDLRQLRRAVLDRYGTSPPISRINELVAVIVSTLHQRGYQQAGVAPEVEFGPGSQRATLVFRIDPGPRMTIGAITVAGDPMMSSEAFLRQIGLTPGAAFESAVLAERLAAYIDGRRARGYYQARVTQAVSLADDGRVADLTLTVVPGPLVRVAFTGDPLPSDARHGLVPIEREGSADEDLLEDSSNRIEEFLRAQGYRDAQAPHTREEMDGQLLITFAVRRGPKYRVGSVEILGDGPLGIPDLRSSLRTRVGDPYTDSGLDADVSAIESVYRARGFAGAKVRADLRPVAPTTGGTEVSVAVSILVAEGARTLVGDVRMEGNSSIPEDALLPLVGLQPATPYSSAQLRRDIDTIQREYANGGYRSATVQAQSGFTADHAQANLVFIIREGPRVFVDHVLIAGNVRTSTETIERELQLKPGDPLGLEAEYESQRRLVALQLFRRAQITELHHGDATRRDLLVTVEEAEPTTLGFGGGLEGRLRVVDSDVQGRTAQKFELAPRAFVDLGRRNLFGKDRSVNLFASVSFHPGRLSSSPRVGVEFTEYRVVGTFHEPRVLGSAIDGVLNGTIEQQIRSSFNLARRSATAQASRRLTRHVSIGVTYQLQHTQLLDVQIDPENQPLIDRVFTQVRLSSFAVQGFYDSRDDPVDSTRGGYFSANTQLAARQVGSEVGFVKSFLTAQVFRPLPRGGGSVLAAQARLGVATGFPRNVVQMVDNSPIVTTGVRDLPEPERFFAGGDTTVRGFALDTLGRPETIRDGYPIGGNAETIFNFELRGPVRLGIQGVGFIDTGNVFARASDVDLAALRTAVGFGLRYKSPVWPIRFDLGFKINPEPGERPSAWFIAFGQAF